MAEFTIIDEKDAPPPEEDDEWIPILRAALKDPRCDVDELARFHGPLGDLCRSPSEAVAVMRANARLVLQEFEANPDGPFRWRHWGFVELERRIVTERRREAARGADAGYKPAEVWGWLTAAAVVFWIGVYNDAAVGTAAFLTGLAALVAALNGYERLRRRRRVRTIEQLEMRFRSVASALEWRVALDEDDFA